MKAIESKFQEIRKNLDESLSKIDFDGLKMKGAELSHTVQDLTLWEDKDNAKRQLEALSKLQQKLEPWQNLDAEVTEIGELTKLGDKSLESEIDSQLNIATKNLAKLNKELAFSGPYDGHNAVLNIHAGAGGTDAQDWASMLLRMYTRWAEKSGVKTKIIEESPGEEAGLKSASLAMKGANAYGKLKGEHGVHRLVRLSPFNANNLRQTSFAKVEVMPQIDQPDEVPIDDKDLKIDVYRAGGHGGQSVNTTDSAVRVTHVPTGISVAIQNERSQIQNKETAMTILRSKLAQLQIEQHAEKISQIKGPNQSAEWGSQIRNYVLHPYNMVKDVRTKHETGNTDAVLDGDLDGFIEAYLQAN
jgi:peptide chain release factor 2